MQDGIIAFWPYDLFPNALAGKVTSIKDGKLKVKGYDGWKFEAARTVLVPEVVGGKLAAALDTLRDEKRKAQDALDAEFKRRRDELFAEAGVRRPGT
jgi:hypothetical protein